MSPFYSVWGGGGGGILMRKRNVKRCNLAVYIFNSATNTRVKFGCSFVDENINPKRF